MAVFTTFSGQFKDFVIFISIISFHELGHIIAGIYYHWRIDKIILLPFGALTIFKEHINKPLKEELIITLMGPIFQILYSILNIWYSSTTFMEYHYALLIFNLLPITPLDGSKLWNIIWNYHTNFWTSYKSTIFISSILLGFLTIILCVYEKSLIYFLILLFLIIKVRKENKEIFQVFSKFLLERLLYPFSFQKTKIIKGENVKKIKRDHKHIFIINGKYQTERQILQKKFDFISKT